MSISRLMQMAAAGAGGEYQISRSLRFNSADSAYLSRTFGTPTNQDVWSLSIWLKKTSIGAYGALFARSDEITLLEFLTTDTFVGYMNNSNIGPTASVYRDPSSWYHFLFVCSSSTAQTLYVNGEQVRTYTATNRFNASGVTHLIGARDGPSEYFNGYLTEINFIDGQALTPSSFGETNETTGVWSPIRYAGSYGTNGFYLNFSDNSDVTAATLGKDDSGNGNNWTPSGSPGFSVTAGAGNDSLVDVPTRNTEDVDTGAGGEVRGNYATWNPLDQVQSSTFSNGNLDVVTGTTTVFGARGTIAVSSGQWYWEVTPTAGVATADCIIGIDSAITPINSSTAQKNVGATATSYGYRASGEKITSSSSTAYGNSYTNNDVIGVALNLDAGEIKFYKNGVVQNSGTAAFTGLSGSFYPAFSDGDPSNALTVTANFGQRPFAYTAPSGFKALVTTNLPEPTVVQGDDYFNTVLYDGTGASQSITGVGFQPDWVWIKERSGEADHGLYDAVRGVQEQLESNNNTSRTTEATGLTAFGTDGFTVGALAQLNTITDTYVAWNWKADGAGVSNGDGTISSTVSVSTTSGFSIVTLTKSAGTSVAQTFGHGLGVAPSMMIVKRRDGVDNWYVYHIALGNAARIQLDETAAETTGTTVWDSTSPTATVFTLKNINDGLYVAYCFAEVEGFSKFGSYTGNGIADGPFVYTGFRPAWILVKKSSAAGANWQITDESRIGYNLANDRIYTDAAVEESATQTMDIVSNGFKMRSTNDLVNASGGTYIYAAFAENPFKYSLAR